MNLFHYTLIITVLYLILIEYSNNVLRKAKLFFIYTIDAILFP